MSPNTFLCPQVLFFLAPSMLIFGGLLIITKRSVYYYHHHCLSFRILFLYLLLPAVCTHLLYFILTGLDYGPGLLLRTTIYTISIGQKFSLVIYHPVVVLMLIFLVISDNYHVLHQILIFLINMLIISQFLA